MCTRTGENKLSNLQKQDLRREVAEDVREIAAPERRNALLSRDTGEAVRDTRIARDLSRHSLEIPEVLARKDFIHDDPTEGAHF